MLLSQISIYFHNFVKVIKNTTNYTDPNIKHRNELIHQ